MQASDRGIAVGRAEHVTYQVAPSPGVAWPQRIGVIPEQASCFQHRGAVDALDAAVARGGTAVLCQVLSGTGGVGKTQLAAHYARRRWQAGDVDLLVWATAGNRDAIVSAYARAGAAVAGADSGDPEEAARDFLAWLETTRRPWLVVLDDVADPGDLRGLWPRRNPVGRVVVTTRRRDAVLTGSGRELVPVGLFTAAEATAYLNATLAAHGRQEDPEQVLRLAQDLGFLPLALAQAVAYLIDRGLDCASYRARFADRRRRLADILPEDGALPDEQRRTVAATWSLSVDLADRLRPAGLARPLLRVASVLNANGIPVTVLTGPPALEYLGSHVGGREVDEEDAHDALHCLHRLNLVDLAGDAPASRVRIHALIQRATRDQFGPDEFDGVVRVAERALMHAWPEIDNGGSGGDVRANAEALHAHAGARLWRDGAPAVLYQVGRSLGRAGLAVSATQHWEQMVADARRHLGPDHPDTLTVRVALIEWRGVSGDRAGAVRALEELLADRLRVLGPDHPDTLNAHALIADWREKAGDRTGTVRATERLLAERLRVLGPDHPDTLAARALVAERRGAAGDRAGAMRELTELLAERLRVFGPDHPDTLITRARIAERRGQSGDRAGAVRALEELLADRLRVLGPDHPDTLATRARIAEWRGQSGDRAGAVAAAEDLLAEQRRVRGPDHPDTLGARALLAQRRGAAGDRAGAAEALAALLADRLRVLGPDHPDTLATRARLAEWRGAAGDREGAMRALRELLAERLRVLGPDHRETLATRASIAETLGAAGDRAGAVRALEELLVDRLRVLGPEHRDIAATRKRIAYWRAGQVRYYLRWRAADGSEQSMGPFAHAATARQAGAWAERGGGTGVEVVEETTSDPP
ncbi:FxSxx-COOH system tetratricopeptide repeat protein [Streptomyces sp. URMC 129]|uniref:FxSxx-COOH system tetratricopeptide repeat protein n=1 Tax=Streptomyces sp. URMC 129 TaxID=3423407 RepID=UPI003F1DC254